MSSRLLAAIRRRQPRRKVFGVGLSRTGTTSLNSALGELGMHSVHFPWDPVTQREIVGFLREGAERLRLSVLWHCDALTDTPVCATFEALDAAYPESRFILTVRSDRHAWLRSCEAFWRAKIDPYLRDHPDDDPYSIYITAVLEALFGSTDFEPDRFSRVYDDYERRVIDHFRGRDDLLVLDLFSGHGWSELCAFLDRPAPDRPFPFENAMVNPSTASPAAPGSRSRRLRAHHDPDPLERQ
jgi:Sulfotransferase domain